jgi:signal transduction histidine kinase
MKHKNLSLRSRIFLSMLVLVVIASIFIIALANFQYKEQAIEYHKKRLQRKERTIKEIINNELDRTTYPITTKDLPRIFRDQIYKIRDINHLDLNIYDLGGKLLISSYPTFSKDTTDYNLSKFILDQVASNPQHRYLEIKDKNGKKVQASYTYIMDAKFKPIGILGLPYLQDNTDQKKELDEFLTRLLIANAIILILAGIIAFWSSNYITKSLKKISDKLKKTVLGNKNSKIEIKGTSTEIKTLINAYNRMVDELDESAKKLAKSEREEAWREMAKQVAHEIKNPLTPMRLTVQSFQRKFDPNDPNIKEKLNEFSEILIDQIDTLTSIASAFSNFAKMPAQNRETLNVVEVVKNATEIFAKNYIEFSSDKEEIIAKLDKTQLIRIVTNLIKNAIQAMDEQENPKIQVAVTQKDDKVVITVSDNGKGIKTEHKEQVFEPKFTTKSSGMGLGLPMIKNIIEAYKGTITFISEKGKGTTFVVTLPLES